MKIVAPISSTSELNKLISEGIDELYFGIDNSTFHNTNARKFKSANLNSIEDAEYVVNNCKKNNVKSSLAINSRFNFIKKYSMFDSILNRLKVDNVIISDIGLILYINKNFPQINIHISSIATCLNELSVELYHSLGAKRIILPRQINAEETKSILNIKNVEIEIFILNQKCFYLNGMCNMTHSYNKLQPILHHFSSKLPGFYWIKNKIKTQIKILNELSPCMEKYQYFNQQNRKLGLGYYNQCKQMGTMCNACFLTKIKKPNIYLKIPGRENTINKKIQDIRFVKKIINYKNETDIKKAYSRHYGYKCRPKNCITENGKININF